MLCCAGKPPAVYLQIYFIFEEKAPASVGAFYFFSGKFDNQP